MDQSINRTLNQNWIQETFDGQVQFGFPMSKELFLGKSEFQKVQIVDSPTHGKILLNDGCFMISERDEAIYHEMMTHTAAFSHPLPKRALVIGGGDGGTARELLRHSSIDEVVMVEIDRMVVDACKEFIPQTAVAFKNPKLNLIIQDGVQYVADSATKGANKFDIICVDSTDPVGFAQPLFGEEFYQNISKILNPDGIVVSQAESPFYGSKMQKKLADVLSPIFKEVHFLNFTNLTYPGGLWSFSFASNSIHPIKNFNSAKFTEAKLNFFYYDAEIHAACFALPKFQKQNLNLT